MQARAEWGAEYEKPTRKREEEEQLLRDFVATVASVRRSCRMQNRRYDDRLCRVRFYAILVSAEGATGRAGMNVVITTARSPDRNKYLKNRVLTAGNRSPPATLPKPNDWPVPKFPPHRIAKKLFSSRLVSALLDLGSVAYPCVLAPHVLAFVHFSSPGFGGFASRRGTGP